MTGREFAENPGWIPAAKPMDTTPASLASPVSPAPVEDGVIILQNGQVVFVNTSAATILDTSQAEIMQRGFIQRLHPDDQPAARDQQRGDPAAQRIEVRLAGAPHATRWLVVVATAIPWNGQMASVLFLSDSTRSRARQDAAQRTAERYRAVIEHVNEGMIVIKDERVAYANARAADIAGIAREEMQQVGFLHRVHPADHAMVLDRQRRRLAGEPVPSRYELRLLLPDGEVRWIGISATVVPWDGEQAALVFFSDISQRRDLEATLRRTLEVRETVLENSLVGISFLTEEGAFRWSNAAMTRMFGLSSVQAVPNDWHGLFPSVGERQRVLRQALACLREGRAYEADLQMRRMDGNLFWVRASGKAVSVTDRSQGTVWAVMDITPHKELEEALARASSEREAIFNSALVGISYNVNRRMEWVNDKYVEMTGYSRHELSGQSTRMLYDDDAMYELHGRETRGSLMRDGVYEGERRMVRRNGEAFWAQLAGRCVSGRNPDAGVIWTVLDVTQRRHADVNMRAALAREKELNDLRSRFVSMTSHEFRTPLTAILSAAELLKDYSDRMTVQQRAELLEGIGAGVHRMTRMLDRVLLLGKADAHMLEFKPAHLDLRAVCKDIVEEARHHLDGGKCKVLLDCADAPGDGIYDEKLLRHIFDNLLSNAIKYSPEGGAVRFRVWAQGAQTLFEVSDCGIGIPAQEIGHLFESFHRASNVGAIAGTGLGLAIVKQSVELHGGSIEVRSSEGQGTCFTVRLG
jgi:PAS domain S-box-containing protein